MRRPLCFECFDNQDPLKESEYRRAQYGETCADCNRVETMQPQQKEKNQTASNQNTTGLAYC